MQIGRMPEERRWPARRRFTESVDRIARNLEQRKRLRLGAVTLPLGTSLSRLIWHSSARLQDAWNCTQYRAVRARPQLNLYNVNSLAATSSPRSRPIVPR